MADRSNKTPKELRGLRKKAERKIRSGGGPPRRPADTDLDALGQELAVHQVELEMQNAKLREAQAGLDESRNKYADLFDLAPIGYFVFDEKGRIGEVNLTGASMLDRDRRDLIGKPFALFVDAGDKDLFRQHWWSVFETGKAGQCEIRLRRPDGRAITVRLDSTAVTDPNDVDKVLSCRTAMTEITDRVRAQMLLREAEAKYHTLVETVDAIIFACDPEGVITYVNPACERIVGYKAEQVVGRHFSEFVSAEAIGSAEQSFAGNIAGEPVSGYETIAVAKGGRKVHLAVNARPLFDADGRIVGSTGVATDITKRKEAEQRIHDTARFPAENPSPVLRIDENGRILYSNRAGLDVLKTWGVEKDRMIPSEWQRTVRAVIGSEKDKIKELEMGDGRTISFDVAHVPGKDYVNLYGHDITERKRAEGERERLLSEVQTERDRMSALVASMPDEVWFADTHKRFTLANPPALKAFALEADKAVDVEKLAASLDVLRPDGSSRPVEESPPLRALKGEVVLNQEEIIRTPAGGELRHRQVSAVPVRDKDGAIIGSVSVVRDITERKQAEQALAASEEKYRSLFSTMTEGFALHEIICDRKGKPCDYRYIEVNPAFEKLTGLNAEDVVGRTIKGIMPDIESFLDRSFRPGGSYRQIRALRAIFQSPRQALRSFRLLPGSDAFCRRLYRHHRT